MQQCKSSNVLKVLNTQFGAPVLAPQLGPTIRMMCKIIETRTSRPVVVETRVCGKQRWRPFGCPAQRNKYLHDALVGNRNFENCEQTSTGIKEIESTIALQVYMALAWSVSRRHR